MGKISEELLLALAVKNSGGGGTSNYNDLSNKPQIGGVTLSGNKSASDLGLVAAEAGKGLSSNDYSNEDKAIVGGVTAALAGKQGALTAGKYIDINANNEISVNPVVPNEAFTYTFKVVDNNSVEIIKTVDGVVVFDEVYSCWDPVAKQSIEVNETFDDAINIHVYSVGERSYTLLIASDTHEAGFKQTTPWYERNTFVETFSTVDHSGEKLITKSELDTALAGKQNTLTFDDTPTDNSNNPVKSNGIYDALALKQNTTDNSLDTTAKTIVGAINEHEGDIDQLKSGLTNLAGLKFLPVTFIDTFEVGGNITNGVTVSNLTGGVLTSDSQIKGIIIFNGYPYYLFQLCYQGKIIMGTDQPRSTQETINVKMVILY